MRISVLARLLQLDQSPKMVFEDELTHMAGKLALTVSWDLSLDYNILQFPPTRNFLKDQLSFLRTWQLRTKTSIQSTGSRSHLNFLNLGVEISDTIFTVFCWACSLQHLPGFKVRELDPNQRASLLPQRVKNPPVLWETWAPSLSGKDPLEEGMATHSNILAWRIPMDIGTWWAIDHGITKSLT